MDRAKKGEKTECEAAVHKGKREKMKGRRKKSIHSHGGKRYGDENKRKEGRRNGRSIKYEIKIEPHT